MEWSRLTNPVNFISDWIATLVDTHGHGVDAGKDEQGGRFEVVVLNEEVGEV